MSKSIEKLCYFVTVNATYGEYLARTGRRLDVPIVYMDGRLYVSARGLFILAQLPSDCDGYVEDTDPDVEGAQMWIGGDVYPVELVQ